jgi:hypothetical protein
LFDIWLIKPTSNLIRALKSEVKKIVVEKKLAGKIVTAPLQSDTLEKMPFYSRRLVIGHNTY